MVQQRRAAGRVGLPVWSYRPRNVQFIEPLLIAKIPLPIPYVLNQNLRCDCKCVNSVIGFVLFINGRIDNSTTQIMHWICAELPVTFIIETLTLTIVKAIMWSHVSNAMQWVFDPLSWSRSNIIPKKCYTGAITGIPNSFNSWQWRRRVNR